MICLGYLSSAPRLINDNELTDILRLSQRNNEAQGVTGLLCHYDGSFLQFLEGDEGAVLETYARIKRDPRHIGLIEVCRRIIEARAFGMWSMGMVRPDRLGTAEQAFVTSLKTLEVSPDATHREAIVPFLDTFRAWIR